MSLAKIMLGEKTLNRIYCKDSWEALQQIKNSSIDLVLTDPPYTISKKTGFQGVVNGVERFAVSMEFGGWDNEMIDLQLMCKHFYKKLRQGGTCIVFYDIWKIESLKKAMEMAGFKIIRLVVWEKTNPVPLNSQVNYLTNAREVAVLGVKGSQPTFNSQYDKGVYKYPIEHSKDRIHPTQKPLKLMKDLIKKHSQAEDIVLDAFSGSGTTALACLQTNRKFICFEKDTHYYRESVKRIQSYSKEALIEA